MDQCEGESEREKMSQFYKFKKIKNWNIITNLFRYPSFRSLMVRDKIVFSTVEVTCSPRLVKKSKDKFLLLKSLTLKFLKCWIYHFSMQILLTKVPGVLVSIYRIANIISTALHVKDPPSKVASLFHRLEIQRPSSRYQSCLCQKS